MTMCTLQTNPQDMYLTNQPSRHVPYKPTLKTCTLQTNTQDLYLTNQPSKHVPYKPAVMTSAMTTTHVIVECEPVENSMQLLHIWMPKDNGQLLLSMSVRSD